MTAAFKENLLMIRQILNIWRQNWLRHCCNAWPNYFFFLCEGGKIESGDSTDLHKTHLDFNKCWTISYWHVDVVNLSMWFTDHVFRKSFAQWKIHLLYAWCCNLSSNNSLASAWTKVTMASNCPSLRAAYPRLCTLLQW